jgi:hypothetical protein
MKRNSAPESDDRDRWKELNALQRANPTKYNIAPAWFPFTAPFDAWLAMWWVAPLPTDLEVKP